MTAPFSHQLLFNCRILSIGMALRIPKDTDISKLKEYVSKEFGYTIREDGSFRIMRIS